MVQITTTFFLIAFSMLAVLHQIALTLSLYWHFWWFDIAMHLFGGVVVALGLFTLADLRIIKSSLLTLSKIVFFVLLTAVAWEVFEYFAGVPIEDTFVSDTVLDMLMGLCGAVVGYYVGSSLRNLK